VEESRRSEPRLAGARRKPYSPKSRARAHPESVQRDEHSPEFRLAMANLNRSIGRLVALLGSSDYAVIDDAMNTLQSLGAAAVGPLSKALRHSPDPRQRFVILHVLLELAPVANAEVAGALDRARLHDPEPGIRQWAWRVLFEAICREYRRADARKPGAKNPPRSVPESANPEFEVPHPASAPRPTGHDPPRARRQGPPGARGSASTRRRGGQPPKVRRACRSRRVCR
jgi:hypothetical protein